MNYSLSILGLAFWDNFVIIYNDSTRPVTLSVKEFLSKCINSVLILLHYDDTDTWILKLKKNETSSWDWKPKEPKLKTANRATSTRNWPFAWGIWTPIWHTVPWTHPSPHRKWRLEQFSHLHGSRSWQTDWQTYHAIPSVAIGHIYVVLWCGLIIHYNILMILL